MIANRVGAAFLSLSEIAEISNQKLQTAIVEILADGEAIDFEGESDDSIFRHLVALFKYLQDLAENCRSNLEKLDESINQEGKAFSADFVQLGLKVKKLVPELNSLAKGLNEAREAQAAASERMHAMEMAVSERGPETELEEIVRDVVEQYISSLRRGMNDKTAEQAQKIDKCGQQIKDLFLTKADRRPIEDTLGVKADKDIVDELEKEIKSILSDMNKNKGVAERTLAAFKKKLERKLVAALKSKEEDNDSLGVSKCLLCQRPTEMKDKVLQLGDKPVYNPQTGRYFLPKIGTSKGSEEVLRGGFRMPLDGYTEAQEKVKGEMMQKSLKDLQQTASAALLEHDQGLRPVASPDRSIPEVRPRGPEYKWTGNNQVMRDHPTELWRPVGSQRPHTTSSASRSTSSRAVEPGKFDDLAAWGQSTGVAVGYDARGSRGRSSMSASASASVVSGSGGSIG